MKGIQHLILGGLFLLSFSASATHHDEHEQNLASHDTTEHAVAHTEATHHEAEEDAPFDPTSMIMHHIKDAHSWHLFDVNDHAYSIPLPVILWTDNGLVTFMSSAFHHDVEGHHVVEAGGQRFVNIHEKIYYASEEAHHGVYAEMDHETHEVQNAKPLDLSITKNVLTLLVVAALMFWIFGRSAAKYRKGDGVPRGIAGFTEPLILFVRDDIAKDNIGEKHYKRFVPYLLTLFFFIWINNLLGLVPFFPGGANVSGNIAFTMILALFTFIITTVNGNKNYWMHIFWMPGVPYLVRPILAVVEFAGIFTKPFSLMIRLFANITAGHIIVLSLVSLVFVFETVWISPASIVMTLFISTLELLVAALQAYIFTMLTALFIGAALEEHHH